jgi:hypothetical protein
LPQAAARNHDQERRRQGPTPVAGRQWIVFESLSDGDGEIYTMTAGGADQTNLTRTTRDSDPMAPRP